MNGRFVWDVQMQRADGEIVEKEYRVHWDPAKVSPEFVAQSCAAEVTVAHGFNSDHHPKMKHVGVSAVLREEKVAA